MTRGRRNRATRAGTRTYAWLTASVMSCVAAYPGPRTAIAAEADSPSAVVFMYHRFGENKYPTTNVKIEQFEAHPSEIESTGLAVAPLPEIVAALKRKKPIPDRTIALTIDDAFKSVYQDSMATTAKGRSAVHFVCGDRCS